jgi:hypothetical protein
VSSRWWVTVCRRSSTRGYATDAECSPGATGQLRKQLATSRRGEVATLPTVGLQLFDIVTVTDGGCVISSEIYRVRGIEEVYDITKAARVFKRTASLGARGRMTFPT